MGFIIEFAIQLWNSFAPFISLMSFVRWSNKKNNIYTKLKISNQREYNFIITFKNNFFNKKTYQKFFFQTEKNEFILNTNKNGLIKLLYNHIIQYPSPANLSYMWSFGSLSLMCFFIQIISGIFLAMHYIVAIDLAFNSVEHIMRDVNGGWFIRYMHANGASAFFFVVYCHIFRNILYKSYVFSNKTVWISGMIIFVLMMATAFIGYVLPWGQMSFWGATVITNLFSVIPVIGPDLVYWLWGGFSVGAATLNRFYSFHYLFPFIIAAAIGIHIFYLHLEGSSNPFIAENRDVNIFYLPLYPYFFIKDLIGVVFFSIILSYFIFFNPNVLGHSDNYIEANSLVTPEHIVPEWYFLPFYAILRSIPNKEIGIIAMGLSIVIFFIIPFINVIADNNIYIKKKNKINNFIKNGKVKQKKIFYFSINNNFTRIFIVVCFGCMVFFLGFIGARPVEYPYIDIGTLFTIFYFFVIIAITILFPSIDEYNYSKLSIKVILQ